jgi:hypothetical protein
VLFLTSETISWPRDFPTPRDHPSISRCDFYFAHLRTPVRRGLRRCLSSHHRRRLDMATSLSPARGAMSPASSPRLPSPPPMPELQFGPQSPLAGPGEVEADLGQKADESARRRIRPGTKAADMVRGPPLVPLVQVSLSNTRTMSPADE